MTLFGGESPIYDLYTEPDCMAPVVYAELLWGYDENECETRTPEGVFAWTCLFTNFALISDV